MPEKQIAANCWTVPIYNDLIRWVGYRNNVYCYYIADVRFNSKLQHVHAPNKNMDKDGMYQPVNLVRGKFLLTCMHVVIKTTYMYTITNNSKNTLYFILQSNMYKTINISLPFLQCRAGYSVKSGILYY